MGSEGQLGASKRGLRVRQRVQKVSPEEYEGQPEEYEGQPVGSDV